MVKIHLSVATENHTRKYYVIRCGISPTAEDPQASDLIYLFKYFQSFSYFIYQDMKNSSTACCIASNNMIYDQSPTYWRFFIF